jgi:hypothetical protein
MRRYDASRARQEARAIIRAEFAEWQEGLAAEAIEQAAAYMSFLITEPAMPWYTLEVLNAEAGKKAEIEEAWAQREDDIYREEVDQG